MKTVCLFLACVSLRFFAYSQAFNSSFTNDEAKYIAYYRIIWAPDSNHTVVKSSEMMRLAIGTRTSCFESVGTRKADSLTKSFQSLPVTQSSLDLYAKMQNNLPGSANRYKVYKNTSSARLLYTESLGRKQYVYVDSFPTHNWHLTDSIATLKGYNCQKATIAFRGRNYEAWFTREIPISEGPYKFYGLPGLIVQVKDSRNNYAFELIKFSKLQAITTIELVKNTIVTTREAFAKGKRDYYEGIANMVLSMPGQIPPSLSEVELQKKKIRQKFNNNIELK